MTASLDVAQTSHDDPRLRQRIEQANQRAALGDLAGAVSIYEAALLDGYATDEVCYNLALLYKQQQLYDDALALLQRCLTSPAYGVSAHYASGECELALGHRDAANEHFNAALDNLALDHVEADQIDEVRQIFHAAIETSTALGRQERAGELRAALTDFLTQHGVATTEPAATTVAPDTPPEHGAPPLWRRSGAVVTMDRQEAAPETVAPLTEPQPGPGTGRLRTTYRRLVTRPLDQSRQHTPAATETLASRAARQRQSGALPTPTRFLHQPVRVAPTVPLPGEETQPAPLRALLARSASDLARGHFDATIAGGLECIALAPDYLPIHLRIAEALAGRGLVSEAIAKCRALIRLYQARQDPLATIPLHRLLGLLDPSDLTAWLAMADLYFTHGGEPAVRDDIRALVERAETVKRYDIAIDYAERLAATAPGDREAQRLAAELQLVAGAPTRALTWYQQLLQTNPHESQAIAGANIGLTLRAGTLHWASLEHLVHELREGNDNTAGSAVVTLYDRVLARASQARADLLAAAALITLAVGDAAGARERFLAAREALATTSAAPLQFAVLYGLIETHATSGAGPFEREWLRQIDALFHQPDVTEFATRTQLFGAPITAGRLAVAVADCLLGDGQADEARAVLEDARQQHPTDPAIRQRLATLYDERGRRGQALDELDALAAQQLRAGQLDAMVETLRRMSALAGNHLAVKARLADRFLHRGFPDEALREYDAIATIHEQAGRHDEAAEALRQAAELAWMLSQRDDAFAFYDRALALAPENIGLRQAYINVLLQGGRQAEAAEQQRAIARACWDRRQIPETIAALHQAIVLDPHDTGSYNRLGEALAAVGEYTQAERVYRRLIRLTPDDPLAQARQAAMATLAKER